MTKIDQADDVREGEQLRVDNLREWFEQNCPELSGELSVKQFPSGYSNLTYLIEVDGEEYVLRRPPHGKDDVSGHDMSREWTILSALDGEYSKAPRPIVRCDEPDVIGAPFYVMERIRGVILRENEPDVDGLNSETMKKLSEALVDELAVVHSLDYDAIGLGDFGRPDGYVERQVEGWIRRYHNSQTDDIPEMDEVGEWMEDNMPDESGAALIHNDYKYDNLVLNPDDYADIRAVLDWEMATIGDPLMDLGTSLAYWIEPGDSDVLHELDFGPTLLPGNFSRKELLSAYEERTGTEVEDAVFYYGYGLYKVAVIAQQIYYRYKQGHTDDPRFRLIIFAVQALAQTASKAIQQGDISPQTSSSQ